MTKPDDETDLTAAEIDAVDALLNAVENEDDGATDVRWFIDRELVVSALAKMRAAAKAAAKEAS